jgi:peptide-methionine (S)-S-oxide reductase
VNRTTHDSAGVDETNDPSAGPENGAELEALIAAIPEGWSRVRIGEHTWGVTRRTRAGGKVISFDAERLGSAEALGANVWITSRGAELRPCEVPAETVWRFLRDSHRCD